jgi:chemotaxis-related protein WspD
VTQLHWSAAARLLDRDMPQGYLAERTAIVSAQNDAVEPSTKSAAIFRIGPEWLSLPTNICQEVAEPRRVHKLPHRTGGILSGLVNIRGELLLCVSLDVLLGLDKSSEAYRRQNHTIKGQLLVCNREGDKVAFFVSEVYGVHRFHPRDLKQVPATVAKAAATYTVGILHWKDRIVGCLDDELLFYALNKAFT